MGQNIQEGNLELLRVGMTEFNTGQFLQVVLGQPGVVDNRLQNQGLAQRNSGAMAAHKGTSRQLGACNHIGPTAHRGCRRARTIEPTARTGTRPKSLRAASFARPQRAALFISRRTAAIWIEQAAQTVFELTPIIFSNRLVAD